MIEEKMICIWLTLYALTKGIRQGEGRISEIDPKVCVFFRTPKAVYGGVNKPDWHATREEALARAEDMRLRKIASLKKQLAKLRALKFS